MRFERGFSVLALVGLLVAAVVALVVYQYNERAAAVALANEQIKSFNQLRERWEDAWKVALTTSRIAVAEPIRELQSIRRELNQAEVPSCLAPAKESLAAGMESSINMVLVFAATSGSDATAQAEEHLRRAREHFNVYETQKDACAGS